MKAKKWIFEVNGRVVQLSNLDKILWPQNAITKGHLLAYYHAVAPWILPYLRRRPLMLQRFPNGIHEASFFEKNAPPDTPSWLPTFSVVTSDERQKKVRFVICNDEASLLYLVNSAAITLHVWMSRVEHPDAPNFLFIDLDPYERCTLGTLASTAVLFRDALEEVGLTSLVKTTGGSGLHLMVPLEPVYTYETVRAFGELVARRVHDLFSDHTTLERMPSRRPPGTVYLDYVQVGKGKTLIAPFSVRARSKAPVSMPIAWDEVNEMRRSRARDTCAAMTRYRMENVPALLRTSGDPWARGAWKEQRLEKALERAARAWR